MSWINGHNIAGYLPENDDEPYLFDSWEDCRGDLLDAVEYALDFEFELDEQDQDKGRIADLELIVRNLEAAKPGMEIQQWANFRSGYQVWWLVQAEE